MPDEKQPASKKLDLSSEKPGKAKRKKTLKGVAPVVQKTVNLSTKKENTEAVESKQKGKSQKSKSDKSRRKRKPRSTGSSLADLLDPETLAKLKGNG